MKNELLQVIEECPSTFDPHMRWDYIKMQIQNIYMCINKDNEESIQSASEAYIDEINRLTGRYDTLAEGNRPHDRDMYNGRKV